jgi:hypothetical protein
MAAAEYIAPEVDRLFLAFGLFDSGHEWPAVVTDASSTEIPSPHDVVFSGGWISRSGDEIAACRLSDFC